MRERRSSAVRVDAAGGVLSLFSMLPRDDGLAESVVQSIAAVLRPGGVGVGFIVESYGQSSNATPGPGSIRSPEQS
jgi:hypothetical protein